MLLQGASPLTLSNAPATYRLRVSSSYASDVTTPSYTHEESPNHGLSKLTPPPGHGGRGKGLLIITPAMSCRAIVIDQSPRTSALPGQGRCTVFSPAKLRFTKAGNKPVKYSIIVTTALALPYRHNYRTNCMCHAFVSLDILSRERRSQIQYDTRCTFVQRGVAIYIPSAATD